MKHNIAVLDPSGRISDALCSIEYESDTVIYSYKTTAEFVSALNLKSLTAENLRLIIICIINRPGDSPSSHASLKLATQIKKHSRLSSIPLLMVGPDNDEIRSSYSAFHEEYIASPFKKSDLALAVMKFCYMKDDCFVETIHPVIMRDVQNKEAEPQAGNMEDPVAAYAESGRISRPVESERRIATVMFADISGFTAMSEKMDPEEITKIMNLCFRSLGRCIEHHGGHIDKFIGDCIMAVFGVPRALENAPLQAVNTAIDLRNTLYSFNNKNNLKIPLDIHIGINTGMVLSGVVGSDLKMDYTVMGDTVNLASRLEDASERGQILIGSETYKATKGRFKYRELKPLVLKGKSEPVPVYEVLSMKESVTGRTVNKKIPGGSSSDRIIYSGLVGRTGEMNRIKLLVMKLLNGDGGIVNIIGEAGIGKSRLVAELLEDPCMQHVIILEGKAISIGRNLSYFPIIDLLKKWTGITEEDSHTGSFAKVERAVRSVHPAEADEIIPFISTLMGLPLTGKYSERIKGIEGDALENLIRKNVRELLRRSSEIKPLIIYIEDLHWADGSSIELLESLYNLMENHRIIFLNAFRPGYSETGERIRKTIMDFYPDNYTEMIVEPLEEKESALLISNLLNISGLPHKLEEQIKERSGGNPFFIEEVVRSLIDDGAIVLRNGGFVITDRIHHFNIPMTINEVLMSRIDRLDDETRNLVKTASVIGRNFFQKIIVQIADNISDIENRLNYLEDIQMIRERKRLDEVEYLFKHALTQEAAYQSLLFQKRKELHMQVADAIETVFSERLHEFYGMLAYHYSMGENVDRAEEYMLKAGEEAMKSSASSEALVYFQQALNLYNSKNITKADNLKLAELERNIGYAYMNKGLLVESVQSLTDALKHYGIKEGGNKLFSGLKFIWNMLTIIYYLYAGQNIIKMQINSETTNVYTIILYRGKSLTVIDTKRMFIDSIDSCKKLLKYDPTDSQLVFNFITSTSVLFFFTGLSLGMGKKILDYIGKNIESLHPDVSPYMYYSVRKIYNYHVGDWDDEYNKYFIDYALKIGDIWMATTTLSYQLRMQVALGSFQKAHETFLFIKNLWDLFNHEYCLSLYYQGIATFSLWKRDFDNALLFLDEGLSHIYKLGQAQITVNYTGLMAMILLYADDLHGAKKLILKGHEIGLNQKHFAPHFYIAYLNAKYLYNLKILEKSIAENDFMAKKACSRKALNLESKIIKLHKFVSLYRTEAFKNIGLFYWYTGKHIKSLKWFKKSIDEGNRLKARPELSRTYFDIAKILMTAGESSSSAIKKETALRLIVKAEKLLGLTSEQCLEKAESMFREMDLNWDLAKLEEFRAGIGR